jgi:hypothetical protein
MRIEQCCVLLGTLAACGNPLAPPDRAEGRLLAAGSLALEWSADGSEIFYYDSGYTTARLRPIPDRILAVNVRTGATRVVVDSGAYGAGGGERPGAVPPRATIAGLAYIRRHNEQFALHLATATGDRALAASSLWFTTTPDRTRLLYRLASATAFSDSIGMIDLVTGDRAVFPTGPYGGTIGATVAPDGSRMLVERLDAEAGFAILSLSDGTITALNDTVLFPDRNHFMPVPLGWNATGVWFMVYGGPPRLVRYDPATGIGQSFPVSDAVSGTRVLTGGTALALAGSVVWSQNCNSTDPKTALCEAAAYQVWLLNPLTGRDDLLVSLYTSPAYDYPRAFFAAGSPDGRSLAYVLGNELRLLPL